MRLAEMMPNNALQVTLQFAAQFFPHLSLAVRRHHDPLAG